MININSVFSPFFVLFQRVSKQLGQFSLSSINQFFKRIFTIQFFPWEFFLYITFSFLLHNSPYSFKCSQTLSTIFFLLPY